MLFTNELPGFKCVENCPTPLPPGQILTFMTEPTSVGDTRVTLVGKNRKRSAFHPGTTTFLGEITLNGEVESELVAVELQARRDSHSEAIIESKFFGLFKHAVCPLLRSVPESNLNGANQEIIVESPLPKPPLLE